MQEGLPYADIVILALIAGFILLRLRSVLGSKDEGDFFTRADKPAAAEPIVQIAEKSLKTRKEETDTVLARLPADIAAAVNVIKGRDPEFTATGFLDGAKRAYEMVFDAFKDSDRATLKLLLADVPFQHFAGALDDRARETSPPETTLVSVKAQDITHAELVGNFARLTVKFLSEQITVVRGPDGKIIEGNASEVHHTENEWTFERDVTSKNPNWKIIET